MANKYQVFVSSTYEDLKDEREVAIKAILEMGHIPVGMEMFSAADDEQWKLISRHIDESDYYCIVVAHRYGSKDGDRSYTQKEYEYAVERGVPVLGFVISDSAPWPKERMDSDPQDLEALKKFKVLVKSRIVNFWSTPEDLYGKVSISLMKAFVTHPREGWVRASDVAGPEVTRELTRLSLENSTLRDQLAQLASTEAKDKTEKIKALQAKLDEVKHEVEYKYSVSDTEWTQSGTLSYADYFWLLAPLLAVEAALDQCSQHLCMNIREDTNRKWWTVATNQVRDLFTDLMALDLVEPSQRKRSVSDKGEYWALTELGRDLYRAYALGSLEARARKSASTVDGSDGGEEDPSHNSPSHPGPALDLN